MNQDVKVKFYYLYGNIPLRNNPSLKRGLQLKGFSVIDWFPVHVGLVYYSIVNQHAPEITPWETIHAFDWFLMTPINWKNREGHVPSPKGPTNKSIITQQQVGDWPSLVGDWPSLVGETWITLQFPGNFRVFPPVFLKKTHWGQVHDMHPSKRCIDDRYSPKWYWGYLAEFLRLDDWNSWFLFAHVCPTPQHHPQHLFKLCTFQPTTDCDDHRPKIE